jgi:thioredoxin-related protein
MKNYLFNFAIIALIPLLIGISRPTKIESINIGERAPLNDYKMKGVSGNEFSLKDLNQENGLLVIFSCNTCPFVIGNSNMNGWENRYNEIYEFCKLQKIGMVLVNSNEAKRSKGDSYNDMQLHSRTEKYDSPYVIDRNSKLADAFGASTTPHVFLFNKELNLVYKGAIDDNVNSKKEVKETWLKDAVESLGKGEKIILSETRNSGCSIKRL